MLTFFIAGIGTSIGALGRFFTMEYAKKHNRAVFPWSTFLINMSASFLIGLLTHWLKSEFLQTLLITGLLGGWSTYSTFANEVSLLFKQHYQQLAILYATFSILGGLFLAWLGWIL